jgi:DNA-binding transcriptional ArsR family regulator
MWDPEECDSCDVFCSDETKVARAKARLPETAGVAELFKVLSDDSRLRIVFSLLHEELCVCDLATVLGLSPPAVSHHLRLLRSARLVQYRRQGKVAFYSLDDAHVRHLVEQALSHSAEHDRQEEV